MTTWCDWVGKLCVGSVAATSVCMIWLRYAATWEHAPICAAVCGHSECIRRPLSDYRARSLPDLDLYEQKVDIHSIFRLLINLFSRKKNDISCMMLFERNILLLYYHSVSAWLIFFKIPRDYKNMLEQSYFRTQCLKIGVIESFPSTFKEAYNFMHWKI